LAQEVAVPLLTLGEAARLCGVPKSTISRAVKSGRLSAGRSDDGSYAIDPAELSRVYEFKLPETAATPATDGVTSGAAQQATAPTPLSATAPDHELAVRLAAAEAELRGLRDMVEELRRSRDKWEGQAERLTMALPGAAQQTVARRGWWPWRRSA
jgi:excisionase family DNA binding protein